jgi:hypothetical protein
MLKHKKLFIAIIAVVVLAAAIALAGVAFGWWTANASTAGNSVSTANTGLVTSGLPITVSGLVPQVNPAADPAGNTLNDAQYPSVSYFYVENSGTTPLMFYGWLSGGTDAKALAPYVDMRIWLLGDNAAPGNWTGMPGGWADTFQVSGGPFPVFDGTLGDLWAGQSAGINFLSSRHWTGSAWQDTAIQPGQYAVYRVAIWLDSSAPDSTQNATASFTINFTGLSTQQWTLNNYDNTAFVSAPTTP